MRDVATPTGRSAMLVDSDDARRASIADLLRRLGYSVPLVTSGFDGVVVPLRDRIDVLVVGATRADPVLLSAVAAFLERTRLAALMLSEDDEPARISEAVNAGVNAYVVVGVNGNRIKSGIDLALANFEVTASLRAALDETKEALEARKLIEKAKGIVMRQKGLDEEAAYHFLRRRAMTNGVRLVEVARTLTEADALLA